MLVLIIDTSYPPISNNITTVPSTSVITALFNNINPANANNLATSATTAVTVGNVSRTLNLQGSAVSINGVAYAAGGSGGSGGDVSANTAFRTAAASEVVVGNIAQNLRMNAVKTQVFGTLAVSSTEGFVPQAFPLHVEGTAKFGGTITVGVGNSVINGTYNMPTNQAPTLTNTTTVATIGTVTSTYNFLNTNTIPNQILNSSNVATNSASPVLIGNGIRTLSLNCSSLTVPSNFLTDLSVNVAPTSTSTITAASASSLTVSYNKLSGLIDSGNTLATTANTTANSASTLATTANTNTNALANTLALITAPALISAFGTVQLVDTYALATYPTGTAPSTQALKQLKIDSTTANNNFGTTASSGVTVGNILQPLTLAGSSLTLPTNFLVDLVAGSQPTSFVTNKAATPNMVTSAFNYTISVMPQATDLQPNTEPTSILVGFSYATPNSLTNAYNTLKGGIPALTDLAVSTAPTSTSIITSATPNSLTNAYNFIVNNRIPAAANHGTTATSAVIVGSTAQNLTLNGSTINITGAPTATHTLFDGMTLGGSLNIATGSGAATLNIGNTGPLSTNLRGLNLSITGGQINISTGATVANTLILGTQNFTNHTIAGASLTHSGLSQNISLISALALGASRLIGLPQEMCIALTSETGAVSVSTTPAAHFRLPRPWRILGVRANLYSASTSGSVSIDIRSVASGIMIPSSVGAGTSIFTTPLSIDATRMSSISSTTAAVLTTAANTTGLNDDSGLAVFVTGAGTGAAGCKIILYYTVV